MVRLNHTQLSERLSGVKPIQHAFPGQGATGVSQTMNALEGMVTGVASTMTGVDVSRHQQMDHGGVASLVTSRPGLDLG